MLYLSTLKGITREGSLETLAEVGHPGPGGDASEVCNRYQDVIASTPVGDELRARYGQVLFIVDNQVRNQLEFPPPSVTATEVPAENTDTGGSLASSPGEGGEGLSKEQVIEILQGKSIEELIVIATDGGLIIPEGLSKDEVVDLVIHHAELPESARPLQTEEKPKEKSEPDLLSGAGESSPGEPSPGSMSPKGKGKGK